MKAEKVGQTQVGPSVVGSGIVRWVAWTLNGEKARVVIGMRTWVSLGRSGEPLGAGRRA